MAESNTQFMPDQQEIPPGVGRPEILVVDDRPENLLIMRKTLAPLDVEVVTASSGEEALDLLPKHDFALFLFDVLMPGIGGLELAEHIRSDEKYLSAPILFITALQTDEDHIFNGYQSGAVDYLLRPVKPKVLRSKVKVFLDLYTFQKKQEGYTAKLEAASQDTAQYIEQLEKLIERTNEMAVEAEFANIQLKQIFDTSSDAMWVIGQDFDVMRVNRVLCEMIDTEESAIVGQKCYDVFTCSLCGGSRCPHTVIYDNRQRIECDAEQSQENGSNKSFIVTAAPFQSLDGTMIGIVESFKDITDRKQAEEALSQANLELKRLAVTDGLTQIANRRRFTNSIEREWPRMARDNQQLAVIMCDVDFFKLYNDQYGHKAGDDCLKAVAGAIDSSVQRAADLVARYGGEEFVVLLPNTSIEGATEVANTIRAAVENLNIPHEASKVNEFVTLSLGVAAMVPILEIGYEKLVVLADQALYRAKEQGRNRVVAS